MDLRDKRWLALFVICLGNLMIVLDTTIVSVALPTIQTDLSFNASTINWVLNAYLLTFGGFLLLGGRLGDLYGYRRLFLIGTAVFVVASVGCGLAGSQEMLVVSRALQGFGGAIVSAVGLSLIMVIFTETAERAKAMGIFGFVLAGGGSIGVVLGGIITEALNWNWIFLVNLPVGIVVYFLSLRLLPKEHMDVKDRRVDYAGAATITASIMIAVYAIVNGNEVGWTEFRTVGLLGLAAILLITFIIIEARVKNPLMPLSIFKFRNVATANVVGVLMAAGLFTAFFLTSFYLGKVLGYSALKVGLAYLPSTVIWGGVSLFLSDRLVLKYGIKTPLVLGLSMFSLGILLFARAPVDGNYVTDVLPAMLLQGFGAGIAFNPLLLAAMSDVKPHESGLASGVVNTAFMMGGALGLAILSSIATSHTNNLIKSGTNELEALTSGYHLAFLCAALLGVTAAIIGAALFRPSIQEIPHEERQQASSHKEVTIATETE